MAKTEGIVGRGIALRGISASFDLEGVSPRNCLHSRLLLTKLLFTCTSEYSELSVTI